MSMMDYETRGYGIQFDRHCGSNTTVEKIKAMLALAPNFSKKVQDFIDGFGLKEDEITVEEYEQFDEDYQSGIPALIASTMNEYFGSYFMESALDDNGFVYLFMPQVLPWECDEFMRTLTERGFCEILKRFYHMLYDEEVIIDSISVRTCS